MTVFDAESLASSFPARSRLLRAAGINTALYPEAAKLAKQFKYGDRMGMKAALVVGPDELAKGSWRR